MRFFGRSDRFNSFAPDCTAPDVTIAKLIPSFLNSFIETASESITSSRRTSSSNKVFVPIFIIIVSVYISSIVIKNLIEKDHKSIVIDELAGIWLAMIPVIFIASSQYERSVYALLALIIFRIFDISKPFPISYIDKNFKNAFGVVLDDLIAAIFAAIFASLITIYLI